MTAEKKTKKKKTMVVKRRKEVEPPRARDAKMTFEVRLTRERIADIFICALESNGSSHWIRRQDFVVVAPKRYEHIITGTRSRAMWLEAPLLDGGSTSFVDIDGREHHLHLHSIAHGLGLAADSEIGLNALMQTRAGMCDANYGDTLLQFICFGEIVYG